jgi:soluble lytic murein transglycosylase-like protein
MPGVRGEKLFDRETNLRLGFRYLHMLVDQYNGDMHLALLAYNRGPAKVDQILQAGGNPANGYNKLIQSRAAASPQ